MKLLFKQRFFSWFDSYDIYDEAGNTRFVVKGKPSWGHRLEIYNGQNMHVGTVKETIFSFLPKFDMYVGGEYRGTIKKEFTFFKPKYSLNCNDWRVDGDIFGWDYTVRSGIGRQVMRASKQLFRWTDTYVIDIAEEQHTLISLMIVLAIDAANCSQDG